MSTPTKDTMGNSGWAAQAKSLADRRTSLSIRYDNLQYYINFESVYRLMLASLNAQREALDVEEAAASEASTEAANEER
jgi:hypothetical protein